MALTSAIAYCENQDVFDIYPQIDKFDLKRKLTSKWIGTTLYKYHNSGKPARLYKNGKELGPPKEDPGQLTAADHWLYNTQYDFIQINETGIVGGTDPNLDIFEIGDDWEDVIERLRKKASRLIESKLGKSIAREILKDREGNYPTSIIYTTALKTAILLIMAHDPNHPDLIPLRANYDDIIGRILSGRMVMTGHRSDNDSKGTLRYSEYDAAVYLSTYNVYPVELRGNYGGNTYELLYLYFVGLVDPTHDSNKDLIYWVKGKTSTKLVDKLLIDETLINFDYQALGVGNLHIRFSTGEIPKVTGAVHAAIGDLTEYVAGNELTVPIIYEIELWGSNIKPTVSQIKSTTLARSTLWH